MTYVMAVFCGGMNMEEDIRTLCNNCKYDYWHAGYKTKSIHAKYKCICDKCNYRCGWTYILIEPEKIVFSMW